MKTSLRPAILPLPESSSSVPAEPLLAESGAEVIVGSLPAPEELAAPVVPSARTLFAPRGACVAPDGSLWSVASGHPPLLGWRRPPAEDATPADLLIGQPAFDAEGRNARGEPGPATLNVPTGIAPCGDALALAD